MFAALGPNLILVGHHRDRRRHGCPRVGPRLPARRAAAEPAPHGLDARLVRGIPRLHLLHGRAVAVHRVARRRPAPVAGRAPCCSDPGGAWDCLAAGPGRVRTHLAVDGHVVGRGVPRRARSSGSPTTSRSSWSRSPAWSPCRSPPGRSGTGRRAPFPGTAAAGDRRHLLPLRERLLDPRRQHPVHDGRASSRSRSR